MIAVKLKDGAVQNAAVHQPQDRPTIPTPVPRGSLDRQSMPTPVPIRTPVPLAALGHQSRPLPRPAFDNSRAIEMRLLNLKTQEMDRAMGEMRAQINSWKIKCNNLGEQLQQKETEKASLAKLLDARSQPQVDEATWQFQGDSGQWISFPAPLSGLRKMFLFLIFLGKGGTS